MSVERPIYTLFPPIGSWFTSLFEGSLQFISHNVKCFISCLLSLRVIGLFIFIVHFVSIVTQTLSKYCGRQNESDHEQETLRDPKPLELRCREEHWGHRLELDFGQRGNNLDFSMCVYFLLREICLPIWCLWYLIPKKALVVYKCSKCLWREKQEALEMNQ